MENTFEGRKTDDKTRRVNELTGRQLLDGRVMYSDCRRFARTASQERRVIYCELNECPEKNAQNAGTIRMIP
jgi:hypothetical protein